MVSLKLPKEADDDTMLTAEPERNDYGYGTQICLEEEQVTALGAAKLAIGTKVKITAYGVISSTSIDVGEPDEGKGPDMRVQLTDMEMSPASSVDPAAMYPSSNG